MNADPFIRVGTRDVLDRMAGAMAMAAPHYLPLLAAVRAGRIALVTPCRASPASFVRDLRHVRPMRPTLLLIGDDDDAATGPAGWACARRLRRWARAAIVHSTGATPEHYRFIVTSAVLLHRLVVVETDSARIAAWAAEFPCLPLLGFVPPDAGPHPQAPKPAEVN